jgi:hypothetical protein
MICGLAYPMNIYGSKVDMGGTSSTHRLPDTSYAHFLACVQAIQNRNVTRLQRNAIAEFLLLLRPVDTSDTEAVLNLSLQYKSCMPLSHQIYVRTLFYFTLCESSLRQKFLNDAALTRDYATISAIEKNPLY